MQSLDTSLNEELVCPISQELLEDPIVVPCCTRAFSREHLVAWFETSGDHICPNCKSNLYNFDPETAPKNIILTNIIDLLKTTVNTNNIKNDNEDHTWSCTLTPVVGNSSNFINVAELELTLKKSKFTVRPCVFIAVIDKSGSMAGSSWVQVQEALIHMLSLASNNNNVKLKIITYDSYANIVDTSGTLEQQRNRIKNISAGGGTTFRSAFSKIETLLSDFICSDDPDLLNKLNNVGSVTIAFLTDGQSADINKNTLVVDFKNMLHESWKGPLSVHSVGFSGGCDKELLEQMRTCGNIEGIFRYAEPGDDGDTLCHKLQSLFDIVNESSVANLDIQLSPNMRFRKNNSTLLKVQFPINENKGGSFKTWIYFEESASNNSIKISSVIDNLVIDAMLNLEKDPIRKNTLSKKWLSNLVDELAIEFVDLVKSFGIDKNINIMQLHTGLILQRINALYCGVDDANTRDRLDYIEKQIYQLIEGNTVNMGKLYDIRFADMSKQPTNIPVNKVIAPNQSSNNNSFQLDNKPALKEVGLHHYSLNNTSKNRNSLQQAITNSTYNILTSNFLDVLGSSSTIDMSYTDNDGNTALLLACYGGFSQIIEKLLEKFPDTDPTVQNNHGETAITLAIKKRGFWKTVELLLSHGHTIPPNRLDGLKQYAIESGFVKTGNILSGLGENLTSINNSMKVDYIRYLFEQAETKGVQIDVQNYFEVCLGKKIQDIVIKLLTKYGAIPTIDHVMNYCIPPIPDSPETDEYLKLCEIIFELHPSLLFEANSDGETLLFKSAERGSLPHVQYFLSRGIPLGIPIDQQNYLGNTALWIACAKRYPCIISELLQNGADVNMTNNKGNPPMYNICQRGPKKIIDTLLSYGADISMVNKNGDTLILICCRNGQHEILDILLNHADEELINHKAHIDGFNAIMSSAEANRPECIKVLHKHGISLNQKTDETNEIIAGATPLHIASYYDRLDALVALLECGADATITDHNGLTCLHLAVMQGNIGIVRALKQRVPILVNMRDSIGYLPMAYCRNNQDM